MFDKNFFKKVIFVVICLFCYKIITNYRFFFEKLSKFLSIMTPFFWGIAFAYILNPLMCYIEKHLPKLSRPFSLLIVYFLFFGILSVFSTIVIPMITESAMDLYAKSSTYPHVLYSYLDNLPNKDFFIEHFDALNLMENNSENIINKLLRFSNFTFTSVIFTAFSVTSGVFNFLLGVFISIYLLYEKEKLLTSLKNTIIVLFSEKKATSILFYFSKINFYFHSFLIGKLIDSTIVGIICYIGLLLMKVKYPILLSIIVGIFNMIPYFGPFMGAIPAILITLLYSPIKALWLMLFILALQQFDGWYLGPKILGNKVGASPLFIIFSILVGGGFAGPLGMLLAVPVFKSLFFLWESFINKKMEKKDML